MKALALSLMLAFATVGYDVTDPAFLAWFEGAKKGERWTYIEPMGDGCNTCERSVIKISDTEVQDAGIGACTAVYCGPAGEIIKVK